MIKLYCGSNIYDVPDVQEIAEYRISPQYKLRKENEIEIVQDFADVLIRGYSFMRGKSQPKKFHIKEVKYDILKKDDVHDRKVQQEYLCETRSYWENHYPMREMVWLSDFQFVVAEIGGKVSDNWFMLYEIIRGVLPKEFPSTISFAVMIDNVLDNRIKKYVNKTVRQYLREHRDRVADIADGKNIPSDIIVDNEIDLTLDVYKEYARNLLEKKIRV